MKEKRIKRKAQRVEVGSEGDKWDGNGSSSSSDIPPQHLPAPGGLVQGWEIRVRK